MHRHRTLLALLVSLIAVAPGKSAVLRVDAGSTAAAPDGASWARAFPSLQAAIHAARPGDEVWVAQGRYTENITVPVADLKLLGGFAGTESTATPVGDASVLTSGTAGLPIVSLPAAASGTLLQGFTIRDGSSGGILCEAPGVVIARNMILENTARHGGGILCRNASVTIRQNVIAHNSAEYHGAGATDEPGDVGGGIALFGGTADIRDNEIADNICYTVAANVTPYPVTAYGGGIGVREGAATIVNNTLAGNTVQLWAYQRAADAAGAGVSLAGSGLVANNIFVGNFSAFTAGSGSITHGALHLVPSALTPVRNNLFFGNNPDDSGDYVGHDRNIAGDPLFRTDPPSYLVRNIRLSAGSPAIDAGDNASVQPGEVDLRGQPRIMDGRADIGAAESVPPPPAPMARVYVRPDGSDANAGDSWATARATVQPALDAVAPGGEVWVAEGVYYERISLPNGARLLGGFAGTETEAGQRSPRRHPAVLDGGRLGTVVTIPKETQGAAMDGFTVRNGMPGGIASFGADATIADNIIEENAAEVAGDNAEADGGGLYVGGGPVTVQRNVFRNNHVTVWQTMGYPQFGNIVTALGGGLYLRDAEVTVANNLMEGNAVTAIVAPFFSQQAPFGGGLYALRVTGRIANNTFTGNSTSEPVVYQGAKYGGAVFLANCGDGLTVANNIVAFNTSGLMQDGTGALLSHNDVFGNAVANYADPNPTGTNGNIAADPLFLDPARGDYHLRPTSPAIDAGDDAFATGPSDLDGNPRFLGPHVDMGAYEAPVATITFADVARALRIGAGLATPSPEDRIRLDVANGGPEGRIDMADAVRLARMVIP